MAFRPYTLWIDLESNRLTLGVGSETTPKQLQFIQGDTAQIEIHALKRIDGVLQETPFPSGSTLKVGIGTRELNPISGTFTLGYDTDVTSELAYNANASQIATALNALPSVSSEGGVSVTQAGDGFVINWVSGLSHGPITANADGLFPKSFIRLTPLSSLTEQSVFMHLTQSVIAYSDDWQLLPSAVSSIDDVIPWDFGSKVTRLSITNEPSGGYVNLVITTTGLVFLGTITVPVNTTAADLRTLLRTKLTGANDVIDVVKTDDFSWDITLGVNVIISIISESLTSSKGLFGTLSFNTAEIHTFLAGEESQQSILEVNVLTTAGEQTILQTPVVIFSDVIDSNTLVPLVLEGPLGEQTANNRYVRRDTTQSPNTSELNNIWLNLGVSKFGTDVAGAISDSDTPSSSNPFLTASQLTGYATESWVGTQGYATESWVGTQGYATQTWVGTQGYATETFVTSQGYAPLTGASFSGTIYTPTLRNLLNADLIINAYNDAGAGTNYLHKFTAFDGRLVLAANGGGLTFPDGSTQTQAALPLTGGVMTTSATVQFNDSVLLTEVKANGIEGSGGTPTTGEVRTFGAHQNGLYATRITYDGSLGSPVQNNSYETKFELGEIKNEVTSYDLTTGDVVQSWKVSWAPQSTGSPFFTISSYADENTVWSSIGISGHRILFPNGTSQYTAYTGPNRVVLSPQGGLASLNLGTGASDVGSTTAGDIWIGDNINFRAQNGALKLVANQNAANAFTAIQTVTANSTSAAVTITQNGTGRSFVVQDGSATPDADCFVIDNSGNVGVGVSNSTPAWGATRKFEVKGEALVTSSASTNPALSIIQSGSAQALYIQGTGGAPAIRITSDLRMSIGCNDSEANTSLTLGRPLGGSALCIQSGWLQIGTVSQGATLKLINGSTIQFTSGVGLEDVLTPQVNPNTSGSFTHNTYPDEVVVKIDGITYAIPARQI